MALRVSRTRRRLGWSGNVALEPHVQAPLTAIDFGGLDGENADVRYYTFTCPELPNADWAVAVWIRPTRGRPGAGQVWAVLASPNDPATNPGLGIALNGGNDGSTYTQVRNTSGTEQSFQDAVPYLNTEVLIVLQRRGANFEQYIVPIGGTAGTPSSVAHDGTTVPTGTYRIAAAAWNPAFPGVVGELAVVLNDSLTAAEVTTLAAGARITAVATPTVELRFRSGAIATETNLGSGGSGNDATRVGTDGFWLERELFPEAAAGGDIDGTAALTFTPVGTLLGAGTLAGSAGLVFGGTGVLAGVGTLAGSATLTLGGTGALAGAGTLAGAAALVFGGTGVLTGSGALAGTAGLLFTPVSVLAGAGVLAGSSALLFDASGTLISIGDGSMTGLASLAFSPTGDLSGDGLLAGSADLVFDASADLSNLTPSVSGASGQDGAASRIHKRRRREQEEEPPIEPRAQEVVSASEPIEPIELSEPTPQQIGGELIERLRKVRTELTRPKKTEQKQQTKALKARLKLLDQQIENAIAEQEDDESTIQAAAMLLLS